MTSKAGSNLPSRKAAAPHDFKPTDVQRNAAIRVLRRMLSMEALMKNQTYFVDPLALTCWKDIAQSLGKGVRTVQRWERSFGLPVRRPKAMLRGCSKAPVVAYPRDLDAWLQSHSALHSDKQQR